jgi:hypothetical protein
VNKLSSMFDARQFAAEFLAARDDSDVARSESDVMMWLEGGAERVATEAASAGQSVNGARVRRESGGPGTIQLKPDR